MYHDETICAQATPSINSTLGIIRISGAESFSTADSIFTAPIKSKPRYAAFGTIADNDNKIDDVILIKYISPKSFTGEDMVEIICHGNLIIIHRILKLLISRGLRMAEPGEFSKRAFLNGKMDLTEAEAINHIIRAGSEWEVDTAFRQMHGSLKKIIYEIKDHIIDIKSDIESSIDFVDQEIDLTPGSELLKKAAKIHDMIDDLLRRCRLGEKISHGIDVVIIGKPNVGKSSILNYVLNQERAIVSDIPGTTRDIIRESFHLNGIQINLIDTAGINISEDKIEKLGIELSRKKIQSSSIILMVIDSSTGVDDDDMKIIETLSGKKTVYLINKIDISSGEDVDRIEKKLGSVGIRFSALKGSGLKELEMELLSILAGELPEINNTFVADMRVILILENALGIIKNVLDLIDASEPIEIIAFELQALIDSLSEITGEISPDDVLHSIFSKFCIGK